MTASTLSSNWYRVCTLTPRLRSHARWHRHRYRGEVWYLLHDPVSNRTHRFTPQARLLIASMDGLRSVEWLWTMANRRLGDDAPTQDEVIAMLGQLHAADLLASDATPDAVEVFERGEKQQKTQRRRSWLNPLALKFHVWDPNAWLDRQLWWIGPLWGRWGALAWLAVVLPALVLAVMHGPELSGNLGDRVLALDNLLLLWVLFPLLKLLHELGHAVAVKRGGGEVHDLGLMLLVLIPVPYVEASASTVFKSRHERAMVGAAGMAVEMFVAALAFYAWLAVEPGLARSILFNVLLVAGVSTLVFNGNPLLRYDAYYILCDLAELPNLATRTLRWWRWWVERHAYGLRDAEPPRATARERAWFIGYGILSTIYRVIVTLSIALFVATQFFFIGVVLALWAVATMVVMPLGKAVAHLASPALALHRRRAVSVTLAAVGTVVVLLFAVPLPMHTMAEGVVWLPERSQVRAGHEGDVARIVATPGATVRRGDLLVLLDDPGLRAQRNEAAARVQELDVSHAAQLAADRAQAGVVLEQLERERSVLAVLDERLHALALRAGTDGRFVLAHAGDWLGRRVQRGELIAHVADGAPGSARVVVPQHAVDLVRRDTRAVALRLAHRPEVVHGGHVLREVPRADLDLPSPALSTGGGGQVLLDPHDPQGTRPLERLFQVDVALPPAAVPAGYGERVHVRFTHPAEPAGLQLWRVVRRLFLSQFKL